jgi:hypothetical protein
MKSTISQRAAAAVVKPASKTKKTTKKKPKQRLTVRRESSFRLADIIRLFLWRTQHGIEIDQNAWLFVICHTLAPLMEREGGLDLFRLKEFVKRHRMPFRDDDVMVQTIHNVCNYRAANPTFRLLSRRTATNFLDITGDERRTCRITTMDAVDETPEERKSLRSQIDRERKERERRAKGMKPQSQSISQAKPWLAEGFKCRRTRERHRKADKSPTATALPVALKVVPMIKPARQTDMATALALVASLSAGTQKEIGRGQSCDTAGTTAESYRRAA